MRFGCSFHDNILLKCSQEEPKGSTRTDRHDARAPSRVGDLVAQAGRRCHTFGHQSFAQAEEKISPSALGIDRLSGGSQVARSRTEILAEVSARGSLSDGSQEILLGAARHEVQAGSFAAQDAAQVALPPVDQLQMDQSPVSGRDEMFLRLSPPVLVVFLIFASGFDPKPRQRTARQKN